MAKSQNPSYTQRLTLEIRVFYMVYPDVSFSTLVLNGCLVFRLRFYYIFVNYSISRPFFYVTTANGGPLCINDGWSNPVSMNPYDATNSVPNFWLSCLIVDRNAMCKQVRGETDALYIHEKGKSCPTEILEKIAAMNAEGRPIWKPMHMQPIYMSHAFVTANGNGLARTNAYIAGETQDVGADIFARGLCLPSDNKMTPEQQDAIIQVIKECFE